MDNNENAFAKTIKTALDSILVDLHTALPAKVVSVDYAKQTVDVQIVVNRITADDSVLPFDVITEVPIGYTQTSLYNITLPINAGDTGQLIFNERQLDNWVVNDEILEPDDTRKHSLSDALFIPNFVSRPNNIPSISATDLEIRTKSGNGKIYIGPDGKMELERNGVKVLETLSNALEVLGRSTCTITAGSSAGTYAIDQQAEWTALKELIDTIRKG